MAMVNFSYEGQPFFKSRRPQDKEQRRGQRKTCIYVRAGTQFSCTHRAAIHFYVSSLSLTVKYTAHSTTHLSNAMSSDIEPNGHHTSSNAGVLHSMGSGSLEFSAFKTKSKPSKRAHPTYKVLVELLDGGTDRNTSDRISLEIYFPVDHAYEESERKKISALLDLGA